MPNRARKLTKAELASPAFKRRAATQADVLTLSDAQSEMLSESRRQYVLDLADDQWRYRYQYMDDDKAVDRESRRWSALRKEFVETADEPLEIHCFTCNYNAHRGMVPLIKLMENSACDAGTALRLYWINDPYYYSRYKTISECPYSEEQDAMRLLRTIKRRFQDEGFTSRKIPFDPTPWLTDGTRTAELLGLPKAMLLAIPSHRRKRA